ncbi:MAG: hypothetical protein M1389_14450 [Chloroflexi bacterium]|nr:hypothetical protein [Chloroflexota bacterium]
MTTEEKIARQRFDVLELAQTLCKVGETCRWRAVIRTAVDQVLAQALMEL